jgi:hypothetical protein
MVRLLLRGQLGAGALNLLLELRDALTCGGELLARCVLAEPAGQRGQDGRRDQPQRPQEFGR